MTNPNAIFAGLTSIALAIFAVQLTSPAGSQGAVRPESESLFVPMTPYGQGVGFVSPAIWRMNAHTAQVSFCSSTNTVDMPTCSPWSKE